MRVTVCELPHEPRALEPAWAALCEHTIGERSELVLLPECAWVEPLWEVEEPDNARWRDAEVLSDAWLARLPELGATCVVGSRPVTRDGQHYNQGYLWIAGRVTPLRSKYLLPDEAGSREARWFARGDASFPAFYAGELSFGLNICTELWALETYAAYAAANLHAILSPRATSTGTTSKWLAAGIVGAVRSGAFSLSSNRIDPTGTCGGVGWIIDPDGTILALTSRMAPWATVDLDLAEARASKERYPRYVLKAEPHLTPVS